MKPSNTIVVSPKYIEEKELQLADLGKTIQRLQEQLNEANEVIKNYAYPKSELAHKTEEYQAWRTVPTSPEVGIKYLEKWGVK